MPLNYRKSKMKYDLTVALRNLRFSKENYCDDLTHEIGFEPDTLVAQNLASHDKDQDTMSEFKKFDKTTENKEAIQDLTLVTESLLNDKHVLTRYEEIALRLTLIQMKSYRKKDNTYLLSRESFGKSNYLTLAHEDLQSKFKDAKKNIGDFVEKIWKKVLEFLRGIFGKNERLKKEALNLLTAMKNIELKKGEVIEVDMYGEGFTYNNEVSFEILDRILETLTEIYEYDTTKIAKAINDIINDEDLYKKVIKESINNMTKAILKDTKTLNREVGVDFKEMAYSDINGRNGKVIAEHILSDKWAISVYNMDGVEIPNIGARTPSKLKEITVISTDEAIKILESVIKVLDINVKMDTRMADNIISKAGKTDILKNDKELISILKELAHFVIQRSNMRYSTCHSIIGYISKISKR